MSISVNLGLDNLALGLLDRAADLSIFASKGIGANLKRHKAAKEYGRVVAVAAETVEAVPNIKEFRTHCLLSDGLAEAECARLKAGVEKGLCEEADVSGALNAVYHTTKVQANVLTAFGQGRTPPDNALGVGICADIGNIKEALQGTDIEDRDTWYTNACSCTWRTLCDIRAAYPRIDAVGALTADKLCQRVWNTTALDFGLFYDPESGGAGSPIWEEALRELRSRGDDTIKDMAEKLKGLSLDYKDHVVTGDLKGGSGLGKGGQQSVATPNLNNREELATCVAYKLILGLLYVRRLLTMPAGRALTSKGILGIWDEVIPVDTMWVADVTGQILDQFADRLGRYYGSCILALEWQLFEQTSYQAVSAAANVWGRQVTADAMVTERSHAQRIRALLPQGTVKRPKTVMDGLQQVIPWTLRSSAADAHQEYLGPLALTRKLVEVQRGLLLHTKVGGDKIDSIQDQVVGNRLMQETYPASSIHHKIKKHADGLYRLTTETIATCLEQQLAMIYPNVDVWLEAEAQAGKLAQPLRTVNQWKVRRIATTALCFNLSGDRPRLNSEPTQVLTAAAQNGRAYTADTLARIMDKLRCQDGRAKLSRVRQVVRDLLVRKGELAASLLTWGGAVREVIHELAGIGSRLPDTAPCAFGCYVAALYEDAKPRYFTNNSRIAYDVPVPLVGTTLAHVDSLKQWYLLPDSSGRATGKVRFDAGSLPGFRPAEGPWASLRRVPGTAVVHLESDTAERGLPAARLLRVELEAGRQTCLPDWAMRLLMCADEGSLSNAPRDPLPHIPSMNVLPKVETAATLGPFINTQMNGEAKAKCLQESVTAESGVTAMDDAKVGQASHMDGVTLLTTGANGQRCTTGVSAANLGIDQGGKDWGVWKERPKLGASLVEQFKRLPSSLDNVLFAGVVCAPGRIKSVF